MSLDPSFPHLSHNPALPPRLKVLLATADTATQRNDRILDRLARMILDWKQGLLPGLPARDQPHPGLQAGPERDVNAYVFRYELILFG